MQNKQLLTAQVTMKEAELKMLNDVLTELLKCKPLLCEKLCKFFSFDLILVFVLSIKIANKNIDCATPIQKGNPHIFLTNKIFVNFLPSTEFMPCSTCE